MVINGEKKFVDVGGSTDLRNHLQSDQCSTQWTMPRMTHIEIQGGVNEIRHARRKQRGNPERYDSQDD